MLGFVKPTRVISALYLRIGPKALLLGTVVFLVLSYRIHTTQELRDFGLWLRARGDLKSRVDPYVASSGIFKSGPIAPWVFLFLHSICLQNTYIFYYLLTAINIFGIIYFAKFFYTFSTQSQKTATYLVIFTLLSSSVRETLVNGQITGILLGGSLFVVRVWKRNLPWFSTLNILATIVSLLILDLKPNIVLPLFLILSTFRTFRTRLVIVTLVYLSLTCLVSSYAKSDLVSSWIRTLAGLNDANSNLSLYGSLNIWQVMNTLLPDNSLKGIALTILPITVYILFSFSLAYQSRQIPFELSILTALVIPFFYSYSHYYSYLPVLIGSILLVWKWGNSFALGALLSFFLLSFDLNITNIVLSLFLAVLCSYTFRTHISASWLFLFGWVSSISVRYVIFFVLNNEYLVKSLLVSIPALSYMYVFYRRPSILMNHAK